MSRRPRGAEIAAEEALPEIDRLEGFPHPRETRQLVGQQAAEQALAQASATGRMHHAWLLTGPEGIGKATLAYRFARFALQGGGGGGLFGEPPATLDAPIDSPAAALVRGLAHPGLMVVRRAYDLKRKRFPASIPIDEVRRLKPFLSLTAEAGEARVVIVDRADELNVNAANALLKSLEEPPPATTFLLISSEPGRLLVTIRSRCRRLELHPLCDADLGRAIAAPWRRPASQCPSRRGTLLAGIARGSPRRALALVSGSGLKLYERLLAIFEALPALDQGAILKLADEVCARRRRDRPPPALLAGGADRPARPAQPDRHGGDRWRGPSRRPPDRVPEPCHLGGLVGNSRPREGRGSGAQSRSQGARHEDLPLPSGRDPLTARIRPVRGRPAPAA
ncbi:MAG: DNA polymerase III subunit delta' [Hyphomicrobiaceae bacterium]